MLTGLAAIPGVAAQEECPPSGSTVYYGTCGEVYCNGEGGMSSGLWVGDIFIGHTERSQEGTCSATEFCFLNLLYLGTHPNTRVGLC